MSNLTNIDTLTTEILMLKQQTAQNIIEIGKRLIQVKESLDHGEWGKYLEDRVDFSQETARKFMQIANEYSNSNAGLNLELGTRKLWLLLSVPSDQREEFISTPQELPTGETKTVDEMTTRELQAAIKAQKELEQKLADAETRVSNLAGQLEDTTEENTILRQANQELFEKSKDVTEVIPEDYESIKAELKEKDQELLALTQSQIIKKNRQMIFNTLSCLTQDLGKHLKRAEMELKSIPFDDEVESDVKSCIQVLENTAYEMKQWIKGDVIDGCITIENCN